MKNYYEILEVNEKASKETISKVFKMQIKKNHPDLFQGDEKKAAEEKTMLLNEAYEVLSDETKREEYDKTINSEQKEQMDYLKNEISILKEELIKKDIILKQIRQEFGVDEYLYNQRTKNNYNQDTIPIYKNIENGNEENTEKGHFNDLKTFLFRLVVFFIIIITSLFILGQIVDKDILSELFKRLFS